MEMINMFIDTHTHMDHKRFDSERNSILQLTKECGITKLINPAIDYESNYSMRSKLDSYDWIYYGVGLHPNCVGTEAANDEEWERGLKLLATTDNERVVAVGETGLDFHRLRFDTDDFDEEGVIKIKRQYKWFRNQLDLSANRELPLILHIRDAHKEAIMILKEYEDKLLSDVKGVVHCFTGNYEDALEYINMGYMIGIGGVLTYSQNEELRKIVKRIPLESIVLETDSPYVMPERTPAFKGKRNMPNTIPYIAGIVAELKGISVEEVEQVTTENAKRLFKL